MPGRLLHEADQPDCLLDWVTSGAAWMEAGLLPCRKFFLTYHPRFEALFSLPRAALPETIIRALMAGESRSRGSFAGIMAVAPK
jgi:hypothetical protein